MKHRDSFSPCYVLRVVIKCICHLSPGAEQEPKGEDAAPAPAGAAGGAAAEASTSQPPNAEETAGRPEVSEVHRDDVEFTREILGRSGRSWRRSAEAF